MDFWGVEYQPAYNNEDGLNYGLYYCPICDADTLHQVLDVDFDNYDVKCSRCGTISVTRADFFDSYEEEVMNLGQKIAEFFPDGESLI
ncbi:hypothetical protein BBF96_10235 [Anoxybacter fermentans]|uniref:Uncharacterized protein n=1 Tax=Anoxybacter fermentans TaxID=1323375 RepID=A0A3Q9HQU8_9FIRM|nr:hypothetical protein [Anoxybacter fermentans]AZR73729.1 hypothetical protein BBF96_10235 [Anoxybacter fermentans]